MTLSRRSFLLGAMAAPAIVRAESLMKLWVPPQTLVFPEWGPSVLEMWDVQLMHEKWNALLRERLCGMPRPAAVCEQFPAPVRAVVHS